jgi:hypothetical protein
LAFEVSFTGNNHFIASGVLTIPGEFSDEMFVVALLDSTGTVIKKGRFPPDAITRLY